MFIAQFKDGLLFKKLIDSIKDLVNEINM